MQFRTVIELGGKTATGLNVPAEVVAALGSSRRPAVVVTVQGYRYRSTVAVMGGRFMIPLSAEHRRLAGLAAGDTVDVDLELDTEVRELRVPPDLAQALASDEAAAQFFAGLSHSQRRGYVEWIESAKKPDTREARVQKAAELLREGRSTR